MQDQHKDLRLIVEGQELALRDAGMESLIGLKVKWLNWKPNMGTAKLTDQWVIDGVQYDHAHRKCYRVRNITHDNGFGALALPGQIDAV